MKDNFAFVNAPVKQKDYNFPFQIGFYVILLH